MKKYIIFLWSILCQFNPVFADDTFQFILDKYGCDSTKVTDLSASPKINLAEPNCAYVNITGISNMPRTKTENLQAWLECYDGNGHYFKKRVVLNAQGNSSLDFPKKNISVKFYENTWGEGKTTDLTFGNWVTQDAFHLKAFYTDFFRGCGKIAYDIYDDIISDREKPFPWQRAGVTAVSNKAMCHPNGFPCYVYLNDTFYGLYVWSLKKGRENMGLKKHNASHIYLDGLLADETIFNNYINWNQFEVRNPKDLCCIAFNEDTTNYQLYDGDNPMELIDESMLYYDSNDMDHVRTNEVKNTIINLSKYYTKLSKLDASNPDDAIFKEQYSQYFDTQGFTDYIVHSLVTNNYDGHWKNRQWLTYDGIKWFVEPYDLDCTFGHHASGLIILPPEWNHHYGTRYYEFPVNAGIQRLFLKYYFDDIRERYSRLREKGLIDAKRYSSYFKTWTERFDTIGYELEFAKWKSSPCIRETIVNPNWKTEDNWENFIKYPTYSPDSTYQAGDKCRLTYRIWTATDTTTNVRPYQQLGQTDSLERVRKWITDRINLLDDYFKFDATYIAEAPFARERERERERESTEGTSWQASLYYKG